jgi:hypothetical protein
VTPEFLVRRKMSFFQRIASHFLNQVLVDGLANR